MINNRKQIGSNNCEIWMIDYLDGNLSKEETLQFSAFLDKNPSMREELEILGLAILRPEKVSFDKKYLLLKPADPLIEMSEPDYLLIKQMEEGLTGEERNRVSELIVQYPEIMESAVNYQKTKLVAKQIVYPRKSFLLRRTHTAARLWSVIGNIAAAAILFIVLLTQNNNGSTVILSATDTQTTPPHNTDIDIKEHSLIAQSSDKPTIENNPHAAVPSVTVQNRQSMPRSTEKNMQHQTVAPVQHLQNRLLSKTEKVNVYETALGTMIPQYLANHRSIQAMETVYGQMEEESRFAQSSIIRAGIRILNHITSRSISFETVYPKEDTDKLLSGV